MPLQRSVRHRWGTCLACSEPLLLMCLCCKQHPVYCIEFIATTSGMAILLVIAVYPIQMFQPARDFVSSYIASVHVWPQAKPNGNIVFDTNQRETMQT